MRGMRPTAQRLFVAVLPALLSLWKLARPMSEKRDYPVYQQDRFEIGPGHALMVWPDRMTDAELKDFNDWIDLMKRKINRIASPSNRR